MDLYKFKASLIYSMSSRIARASQRNPVSKNLKEKGRVRGKKKKGRKKRKRETEKERA